MLKYLEGEGKVREGRRGGREEEKGKRRGEGDKEGMGEEKRKKGKEEGRKKNKYKMVQSAKYLLCKNKFNPQNSHLKKKKSK